MEDLRRSAGSRLNKERRDMVGLGVREGLPWRLGRGDDSWTATDGRSNDQDRTRSKANT